MYSGAGFYGIRKVLLAYARLPGFFPLPVAVQHGWQRFATAFETSGYPPEIWVSSQRIASEYEKFYPKNKIRVVGSFFCYLMELFKKDLPPAARKGSICIPPHSSHFVSTEYLIKDFVRTLDDLAEEYRPVTVMLYYLDMNSSTVEEYEKNGYRVVCNGSLFDENFIKNFVRNVYDKQHCIFSEVGSGVMFSSYLGLNLFHIDIESRYINRGENNFTDEMRSRVENFDKKLLVSLNGDAVSLELGSMHMLTPEELRKALIRNYFTWSFVSGMVRRIVGGLLRKIGILSPLKDVRAD